MKKFKSFLCIAMIVCLPSVVFALNCNDAIGQWQAVGQWQGSLGNKFASLFLLNQHTDFGDAVIEVTYNNGYGDVIRGLTSTCQTNADGTLNINVHNSRGDLTGVVQDTNHLLVTSMSIKSSMSTYTGSGMMEK